MLLRHLLRFPLAETGDVQQVELPTGSQVVGFLKIDSFAAGDLYSRLALFAECPVGRGHEKRHYLLVREGNDVPQRAIACVGVVSLAPDQSAVACYEVPDPNGGGVNGTARAGASLPAAVGVGGSEG